MLSCKQQHHSRLYCARGGKMLV